MIVISHVEVFNVMTDIENHVYLKRGTEKVKKDHPYATQGINVRNALRLLIWIIERKNMGNMYVANIFADAVTVMFKENTCATTE
jgi:hypothetical protein